MAQEKPEDQDASPEPSSSQASHFCAQLSPAGCVNVHSPPLHAPARHFQLYSAFLAKPRRAKHKLTFSVMCSPWLHLFLLLFPTAGVPWRWAVILNRGEHHHNNNSKAAHEIIFPPRHISSNSKHWPPELVLRARLCTPNLKNTFPLVIFQARFSLLLLLLSQCNFL